MPFPATNLADFNTAEKNSLTSALSELFGSPELALIVVARRPFNSVDDLCEFAATQLKDMDDDLVLRAVHAHPPIGASVRAGTLSGKEQAAALSPAAEDRKTAMDSIRELNVEYEQKFGHVFLIRAFGLSAPEILHAMEKRLGNDEETEWATTRQQLGAINDLRLRGLFAGDLEEVTGYTSEGTTMSLSTHVLDTSTGLPARGMEIELFRVEVTSDGDENHGLVDTVTTDPDGRHRFSAELEPATYRLRFKTGDFLASADTASLYPWVDIHFVVTADKPSHLHVPLLLSPFGYTTYRGS